VGRNSEIRKVAFLGDYLDFPRFVSIVLGATHPNLVREQGDRLIGRIPETLTTRLLDLDELTGARGADVK
jgi:hypothetical protein